MRIRKIELEVKVKHEDGTETTIPVTDSYQEPESLSDIRDMQISDDEKLRAFQYGLYNIRSAKVRSANNFGSLATKLYESGVFSSTKEALEFIIRRRESK